MAVVRSLFVSFFLGMIYQPAQAEQLNFANHRPLKTFLQLSMEKNLQNEWTDSLPCYNRLLLWCCALGKNGVGALVWLLQLRVRVSRSLPRPPDYCQLRHRVTRLKTNNADRGLHFLATASSFRPVLTHFYSLIFPFLVWLVSLLFIVVHRCLQNNLLNVSFTILTWTNFNVSLYSERIKINLINLCSLWW